MFVGPKTNFLRGGVRHDDDVTETPDPVQAQIQSHPGIKYPVRGIPPSDNPPLKRIELKFCFCFVWLSSRIFVFSKKEMNNCSARLNAFLDNSIF